MASELLRFPPVGWFGEDDEMRTFVDDEECDALDLCPLEATSLYLKLRRRMDFATGIVGGPKRRITWGELAEWIHRDGGPGRRAVTPTISQTRRLVGRMVKQGLLAFCTDRENDHLQFVLPLAHSDAAQMQKLQDPVYAREIAQTLEETQNCVSLAQYQRREATTGAFVTETSEQGLDRGRAEQADSQGIPLTTGISGEIHPLPAGIRQGLDRGLAEQADNNNPFTPISSNKNIINTNSAPAREEKSASSNLLRRSIRQAIREEAPRKTPPPRSVQDGLLPDLETLGYDERSGFSVQISPGLRQRAPELVARFQQIIADEFGGKGGRK